MLPISYRILETTLADPVVLGGLQPGGPYQSGIGKGLVRLFGLPRNHLLHLNSLRRVLLDHLFLGQDAVFLLYLQQNAALTTGLTTTRSFDENPRRRSDVALVIPTSDRESHYAAVPKRGCVFFENSIPGLSHHATHAIC